MTFVCRQAASSEPPQCNLESPDKFLNFSVIPERPQAITTSAFCSEELIVLLMKRGVTDEASSAGGTYARI